MSRKISRTVSFICKNNQIPKTVGLFLKDKFKSVLKKNYYCNNSFSGILKDKTMDDKLMQIKTCDKQNNQQQ